MQESKDLNPNPMDKLVSAFFCFLNSTHSSVIFSSSLLVLNNQAITNHIIVFKTRTQ